MSVFSDRQQQIYELLQSRQRVSTEEIRRHFSISSATASRDIHALVAAGVAVKVSHGVKLAAQPEPSAAEPKCYFCGEPAHERTAFIIQMFDGSQRNACCAHCGLMGLEQSGVQMAMARDFLYGRMVNARQATYLLESKVRPCCEPSVLCFGDREDAECFQKGFGGKLYELEEAALALKKLMSL